MHFAQAFAPSFAIPDLPNLIKYAVYILEYCYIRKKNRPRIHTPFRTYYKRRRYKETAFHEDYIEDAQLRVLFTYSYMFHFIDLYIKCVLLLGAINNIP